MMVWMPMGKPTSASPEMTPCEVARDNPMVASGTNMVTRFR
ncbi:Uncharacterised protein [Mycobacterium tuberculosis]|nr:Uncharacterised protein [Mycobacterium tuberculosis]